MKAVVYARYSTDLQSGASIEDQIRVCRERIEREGWHYLFVYHDRAMSGTSHLRPGYQKMLDDARRGAFEVVVSESLDRLSRDQEHVAHLFKHLSFAGVNLVTLSEGLISELHVGLTGTMGALYVKQLAEKTHRGLRGRVEAGRSGGGLTYGYDVVRTPRPDGTFEVGGRCVNEAEALVVRRIFEAYAAGKAPRRIAMMLNAEGIAGPRGRGWGASTINGNTSRGTGIINNRLYVGKMVWNKLKYVRDPDSGKRRSRVNAVGAVVEKDIPELRIIDQQLWNRVKDRQAQVKHTGTGERNKPWDRRRPRYLLSGLAKCGQCGGGLVMISQTHLGCATARNKGMCKNRRAVGRIALEATILDALRRHLMAPELFQEFCDEFIREVNRLTHAASAQRCADEAELLRVRKRLRQIVDAIADGLASRSLKDELLTLEAREDFLQGKIAVCPATKVLLSPNMAQVYRGRVAQLHAALCASDDGPEAMEAIRALIEKVVVTPAGRRVTIDLYGQIAAILKLSSATKADAEATRAAQQLVMVAGARFGRCHTSIEFMMVG